MGERTQFSRLSFAGLVLFSLNNLKRNFKILDKDSSLISFQVVSEASHSWGASSFTKDVTNYFSFRGSNSSSLTSC